MAGTSTTLLLLRSFTQVLIDLPQEVTPLVLCSTLQPWIVRSKIGDTRFHTPGMWGLPYAHIPDVIGTPFPSMGTRQTSKPSYSYSLAIS